MSSVKEMIDNASSVIAHYWPMTSFVHHNPIRSLEKFPFDEAVKVARRFIGGHGYLPNEMYRKLVKSGRIKSQHIDAALKPFSQDKEIELAGRKISHSAVLHAHLLEGISAPSEDVILAQVNRKPNKSAVHALAKRLNIKSEPRDESLKIARNISLSAWCDQEFKSEVLWQVDRELIKWCEAFIDEGHANWAMPEREKGFYAAWKSLAAKEWSPYGISESSKKIRSLPECPEEALLEHLKALGIPEELREEYISLQLTALYGWASFINWRSEHGDYDWQVAHPVDLVQYLAVRLFYERELVDQACKNELGIAGNFDAIVSHVKNKKNASSNTEENTKLRAAWRLTKLADALSVSLEIASDSQLLELLDWLDAFPEADHGAVWLNAYEAGYHEDLIGELKKAALKKELSENKSDRPLAQLMFCIDVRSEPLRRHIESVGNYETIGFAGFFGIPIRCQSLDQHHLTDQCPAIVSPAYTVHEVIREGQCENHANHNTRKSFVNLLHEIIHDLKANVFTPYIMVETLGWFFGLQMLERTIFPGTYRKWREKLQRATVPKISTRITADKDENGLGLSQEEQNKTIEGVLKTMGLTKNFARLVVVAGHTSMSDNNPYEAALNCGACGGNSGEPNARLLAYLANKPEVRVHLAKNGIEIPEDTYFLGAVHNTTTDILDLYDLEDLPDTHLEDLKNLKVDLEKAAVLTNQERCIRLPSVAKELSLKAAAKEANRRAGDWSETRPEWGLSGNAAFIIGRRELTSDINLEARSFLNSYDYRIDPTGALLEGILMGPMVVGQWINAEHYFSATDPEIYGSGSKIYHNVVGRIGIMSGPQSDLRTGLALQSVANGQMTYHEPLRLFVAIEAPKDRILEIIERQPVLKQLCDNEWIHLLAIDHDSDKKLNLYKANQGWAELN